MLREDSLPQSGRAMVMDLLSPELFSFKGERALEWWTL